jgi:hypothetical protein
LPAGWEYRSPTRFEDVVGEVVDVDDEAVVAGALGVAEPVIELGGVAGMFMVSGSVALAWVTVVVGVAAGVE